MLIFFQITSHVTNADDCVHYLRNENEDNSLDVRFFYFVPIVQLTVIAIVVDVADGWHQLHSNHQAHWKTYSEDKKFRFTELSFFRIKLIDEKLLFLSFECSFFLINRTIIWLSSQRVRSLFKRLQIYSFYELK